MKAAFALVLVAGLAACGEEDPVAHIYRYPAGVEPATAHRVGGRYTGPGVIVDYHNHALAEPEEDQRWVWVPGAFLLTQADGTILQTVAATRGPA